VFEALRTDPVGAVAAEGRTLRFLANVDPVDVARATSGASLSLPFSLLLSLSLLCSLSLPLSLSLLLLCPLSLSLLLLLNSYDSFINMKSPLHNSYIYTVVMIDSRFGSRVYACSCRLKNHDDC
jgi:hypothetical protein